MTTELVATTNHDLTNSVDATVLRSLTPIALLAAEQDSMDQMISKATKAKVPAALRAIKQWCRAIPPEILATEIATLIEWARAFNVPVGDPRVVTQAYIEALQDYPLDIVRGAFRAVRAAHKWKTLPMPGDLRIHCSAAFHERTKIWHGLVKLNRAHEEPAEKIVLPEERAEVAEKLAGLAKSLRAKVPPPRTSDHSHEINERMRAKLAPQIEASRAALMEGDER